MNIMDFIEENSLIIVLSLMVSSILFVTMIIVLFIRMSKLNKSTRSSWQVLLARIWKVRFYRDLLL